MAILSNPNSPPPSPELQSEISFNLDSQISPTILLSMIILAIIFFFSGLLHLLLRFFHKNGARPEDFSAVDGGGASTSAFQGQLRQLFHLHDAGVDQSFIDTLPVFLYKAIIGLKLNPFDCSVCLSEFHPNDKLRLLTKCSHAFHMDCIDTWLLTNSTCPLCRTSLISDFAAINGGFSSPIVGVLESASNSSGEIAEIHSGSFLGFLRNVSNFTDLKLDEPPAAAAAETVVRIKLGNFKSLESDGEGSSNVGSRRCFSMGSFGYVMDENSSLKVPIRTPAVRKPARKKRNLPLTPGNRAAMSECDCESRREFSFTESERRVESFRHGSCIEEKVAGAGAGGMLTEFGSRAFSFRFPASWNRPRSENGMETRDEENQRRNSVEFVENRRSFVRRTMQRLMGKNTNRIVHSSFTPNADFDS